MRRVERRYVNIITATYLRSRFVMMEIEKINYSLGAHPEKCNQAKTLLHEVVQKVTRVEGE